MSDRRRHYWFTKLAVMVVSPWVEKNPVKTLDSIAPIVFSSARVIAGVMSGVIAWRIARTATIGWPEATLAIACVFAMPLLSALSQLTPEEVVAFGSKIVERFGIGGVAQPPFPGMDQDEHSP